MPLNARATTPTSTPDAPTSASGNAKSANPSSSPEIKILGRYEPTELTPDALEIGFRALPFLADCCRRERVSVRIPQGLPVMADNLQWHQDGGGPAGTTDHMVVWASEQPTELRQSDGYQPTLAPFDVVWFNNRIAFHRQPAGTDETRRWFVAIRCSGATV